MKVKLLQRVPNLPILETMDYGLLIKFISVLPMRSYLQRQWKWRQQRDVVVWRNSLRRQHIRDPLHACLSAAAARRSLPRPLRSTSEGLPQILATNEA